MHDDIVIYEPGKRRKYGFFKTWVEMLKNIIKSKDLILQLFKRDFFVNYKKSFVGWGWVIFSPIVGIVSWVFMNATGVLKPGDVGIPYPAYVLFSTSMWGLFMGFYSAATGTLSSGAAFIIQVNYAHEALLIKQTIQHLTSFAITFIINIVVLIIFGVIPSWKIILFPIVIMPLFFLGAGLGLIICVIVVVAVDIDRMIGFFFTVLMYCTPIIYSSKPENEILKFIISINPLTYLIGNVRDMVIYGKMDHFDRYIYSSIAAIIIFLFSLRLFYVSEEKVIEKMS